MVADGQQNEEDSKKSNEDIILEEEYPNYIIGWARSIKKHIKISGIRERKVMQRNTGNKSIKKAQNLEGVWNS